MVKWLTMLLILVALAACADGGQSSPAVDGEDAITVEGPALVMFYTDN